MSIILALFTHLLLNGCYAEIVDITDMWGIKCPQGCSCEIQKFTDQAYQRWTLTTEDQEMLSETMSDTLAAEFLKVAICVIAEDPQELLSKLPSDIQIFTILESGKGDSEIVLRSTDFEHFTNLISLDIQGLDTSRFNDKQGGLVLSVDALFPLGLSLLYLNLERVQLTSPNPTIKKANLVVKPMDEKNRQEQALVNNVTSLSGHRLILLSQQNSKEKEDKEILPYDVYKQETEGYRDSAELFAGLGTLTHLRIYDCALKDISWHLFDGLHSLIHLSLEKNGLKFIPEFCFYGTPNLKVLSLASNQLLTLNSVDLAGLLMLERLDLTGNNLTFLSELSFPPFPALRIADFRGNPLNDVFPSTFEIMNTTLRLYLGGPNSKLGFQKNSFLGLQKLQVLYLINFEVEVLERFVLQGMPALLELKVRGNISRIEFDAFVDSTAIEELDLSYCHIRTISMDAFYGLDNVKRIDLSNNELESIPPGLFDLQQQKELRDIILSKNKLTNLPGDFFKMLRQKERLVQNVRLDGNPWDCTCSMATWNIQLVSRNRETAPRCWTPKKVRNWGVFHALRKGGFRCKSLKLKKVKKYFESNNIDS